MSVHVMSWVLKHSEERLGNRLVLLVLADHASEDGTGAWPSVGTIAREARMSESQTRACLRKLEAVDAIRADGKSRAGTVIYNVVMGAPESGGGRNPAARGVISGPEPSLDQPSEEILAGANAPARALQALYDPAKGIKINGRNLPWDALVKETGADEKVEAGQISRALKLIRGFEADGWSKQALDDPQTVELQIARNIEGRAHLYRSRWPEVELTPTALAKHWARVLTEPPGGDVRSTIEAAQRGIDAARRTT